MGIYDVTKRSFTSSSFSLLTPFDELTISTGRNIVEKLLVGENKLNLNSYFPIVVHHHCCPFMLVLFFFPVGQKKSMCKCGRKIDFGTTTRREKKVCKTVSLVSHTKESQRDLIATLRGGGTYQLWDF